MKLDSMTAKELRQMRERIDAEIIRKQKTARTELRATFTKMASDSGLTLQDIMATRGPASAKAGRLTQQLRDSKTGVTWAGRGRLPKNFDRERAVPV